MVDVIACEPQFVDHAAPVWRELPADVRGRFRTPFVERAARLGVVAEELDVMAVRAMSDPPKARPGDGPAALVVSIGDTKVARRLGYRRFITMEHGAGQAYLGDRDALAHPSYAGGRDRDDTILFVMPNDYSADLWRRAYPATPVRVVGSPRLDELPSRGPGPGPVVAISFHWPSYASPEAGNAWSRFRPVLGSLAAAYRTIGHAHPKGDWPDRMALHYRHAGIQFVPDFDDVCRQADVYVCDNSSTIFEFASTGRPVVLLNSADYRKHVHHGLRFWDAATVGVQVDAAADLLPAIARALEERPEDVAAREQALSTVYAYRSGAAARAAAAVVDVLAPVAV